MISKSEFEKLAKSKQTDMENILREYCQHLFLSFLYRQRGAEKLLFKGGTALRIIYESPRFSEDLDFTGMNISAVEVEEILANAFAEIERAGIDIEISESKKTTGGYLAIATFILHDRKISIQIEISFRGGKKSGRGERTLINGDYAPPYTLVQLSKEDLVQGKIDALVNRKKPRDFYDYYFFLSGNFPAVRETENLETVRDLLKNSKINFRSEFGRFLPAGYASLMRDFRTILERKIKEFL